MPGPMAEATTRARSRSSGGPEDADTPSAKFSPSPTTRRRVFPNWQKNNPPHTDTSILASPTSAHASILHSHAASQADFDAREQEIEQQQLIVQNKARLTHRLSLAHLDMVRKGLGQIKTGGAAEAAAAIDMLEKRGQDESSNGGEKFSEHVHTSVGGKLKHGLNLATFGRRGEKNEKKTGNGNVGEVNSSDTGRKLVRTRSSLRLDGELLNLQIAQLAVQKNRLEQIIRDAKVAKLQLKEIALAMDQKRNELQGTMRDLKLTAGIENLISMIPHPSRREDMIDSVRGDLSLVHSAKNAPVRFAFKGPATGFAQPPNGLPPTEDESEVQVALEELAAGRSLSLYPTINGRRQGDPIADRYHMILGDSFTVAALADGCGWGQDAANAAAVASEAFVSYMQDFVYEIDHPQRAVRFMLRAFKVAHERIIDGVREDELFQRGTTTMIGCVLLPIDVEHDEDDKCLVRNDKQPAALESEPVAKSTDEISIADADVPSSGAPAADEEGGDAGRPALHRIPEQSDLLASENWALIWVSLGDCKAFRWNSSSGTLRDITEGNRMNVNDTRDPGGRMGPYHPDGSPDIRNVAAGVEIVREGDIICLVSDGVHDNLDPQYLGHAPVDLAVPVKPGGNPQDWHDVVDEEKALKAKSVWTRKLMDVLAGGKKSTVKDSAEYATPANLVQKLTTHADVLSKSARKHMEEGNDQPDDPKKFPGKMDHSTALAFRVLKHPA